MFVCGSNFRATACSPASTVVVIVQHGRIIDYGAEKERRSQSVWADILRAIVRNRSEMPDVMDRVKKQWKQGLVPVFRIAQFYVALGDND